MNDFAWIDPVLAYARPQALGALRHAFGDPDWAEVAFQEACRRALQIWPRNGPPRDPVSWLILVGRNCGAPVPAPVPMPAKARGRRTGGARTPALAAAGAR